MFDRVPTHPKSLVLAASALALLLAGCSGRDAELAEKLARAEAAANRAEEAATRAEAAVRRMPIAGGESSQSTDSNEQDEPEPKPGEPMVNPDPAA